MFDLLIRNATVYDGSSGPAYVADVAVADGKIAAIGKELGAARRTVDADLVLFDYDTILDHADFEDCFKLNTGIHQVYIGGELVMEDNRATGICNGRYLASFGKL